MNKTTKSAGQSKIRKVEADAEWGRDWGERSELGGRVGFPESGQDRVEGGEGHWAYD